MYQFVYCRVVRGRFTVGKTAAWNLWNCSLYPSKTNRCTQIAQGLGQMINIKPFLSDSYIIIMHLDFSLWKLALTFTSQQIKMCYPPYPIWMVSLFDILWCRYVYLMLNIICIKQGSNYVLFSNIDLVTNHYKHGDIK